MGVQGAVTPDLLVGWPQSGSNRCVWSLEQHAACTFECKLTRIIIDSDASRFLGTC